MNNKKILNNLDLNCEELYPSMIKSNDIVTLEKGEIIMDDDIRIIRSYKSGKKEEGAVIYLGNIVSIYNIENDILTLTFNSLLDTTYGDMYKHISEELSVCLGIESYSDEINITDDINIYRKFISFDHVNRNIFLCNEYIGYYKQNLDVFLIDYYRNTENLELIHKLLHEIYNNDSELCTKFNTGISLDYILADINNNTENFIILSLNNSIDYKYEALIKK